MTLVCAVIVLAAAGGLLVRGRHAATAAHEGPTGWKWGTSYAAANDDDARAFGLDLRSFAARGRFLDRAGKAFAVGSVVEANRSGECLAVVGPGGDTGSACSQPHLFSRSPVIWLEGFEGGPAVVDRTSEYVAGLASPAVRRISVVESDGTSHDAGLNPGNAFFFAIDHGDLARGTYVDHLEARGASGAVVQRVELNDGT